VILAEKLPCGKLAANDRSPPILWKNNVLRARNSWQTLPNRTFADSNSE